MTLWRSKVLMFASSCVGLVAMLAPAQDEERAKRERLHDTAADFWIYDDLKRGLALGAERNAPVLVSIRCVP